MQRTTNINRKQLVCIIVDTSGTMKYHGKAEGANKGVQEAIMECQSRATDGDSLYQLLLITFDNEPRIYPGFDFVDCNSPDVDPDKIQIDPTDGATNITAALKMAHDHIAGYMKGLENHVERDKHPLPLVLLLTDGKHSSEHWPEGPKEIADAIKALTLGSDSVQIVAAGVATPGIPGAIDATSLAEIASPGCSATIGSEQIAKFIATVAVTYVSKDKLKESVEQFNP